MRKSVLRITNLAFLIAILMLSAVKIASALDADEVLDNFRKEYKTIKTFSADFEQTTLVAGRKRVANGKITFQKPNLIRQEFFDPSAPGSMSQLIVSDGKTIISYTPLIKQVTRQDIKTKKNGSELFPGFGKSLEDVEKNYDMKIIKDELAEKQGVISLELTPKSQSEISDTAFDVMQVWIRQKDSMPVQFMYKDNKNETTFILSFKNMKVNEKIDKSVFIFNAPDDAQVITIPTK